MIESILGSLIASFLYDGLKDNLSHDNMQVEEHKVIDNTNTKVIWILTEEEK
jgi:hypothetical protein|tara:strand:- start:212 stop:367 length:156 start_codon:yes stop_codon:yes gene_type:complete